jgi:hypothetical protein
VLFHAHFDDMKCRVHFTFFNKVFGNMFDLRNIEITFYPIAEHFFIALKCFIDLVLVVIISCFPVHYVDFKFVGA